MVTVSPNQIIIIIIIKLFNVYYIYLYYNYFIENGENPITTNREQNFH